MTVRGLEVDGGEIYWHTPSLSHAADIELRDVHLVFAWPCQAVWQMGEFEFQDWHWLIIGLVLFAVLAGGMVWLVLTMISKAHAPFRAEERRYAELAAGAGTPVNGLVLAWMTNGASPREGLSGYHLTVRFELAGIRRESDIAVWIDDALAAQFAPGAEIALLVDSADPPRIAIDRSQGALQVPRARGALSRRLSR